jgi:hypothetical protein
VEEKRKRKGELEGESGEPGQTVSDDGVTQGAEHKRQI